VYGLGPPPADRAKRKASAQGGARGRAQSFSPAAGDYLSLARKDVRFW
jgi:hypothetical protein